jgi:hypothetical protein
VQSTAAPTTSFTTQASIPGLDCDFSTPCFWNNLGNNNFNWTIIAAIDSPELFNGPSQDHNGGSINGGFYLIADTRFVRANKSIGRYESPPMNRTKCVEFWYYMYGSEV